MCSACLGPLIVAVDGWSVQSDGVALFSVRISGAGPGRTVLRRYREFRSLDREMRKGRHCLPELPPRSLLRKRLQPGFMEARRRGLTNFLAAAVATDPFCLRTPALRRFLGLHARSASGVSLESGSTLRGSTLRGKSHSLLSTDYSSDAADDPDTQEQ